MQEPFRVPLIDASVEIRFHGDVRIEAWRGEFQQQIRKKYPLLFVPGAEQGLATALQHYRFFNESQTAHVGLAVHSLAMSQREYPGWDNYKSEFMQYWELLSAKIAPQNLTRVGLRFVNHFDAELLGKLRQDFQSPYLMPLSLQPTEYQSATRFPYKNAMLLAQVQKTQIPERLVLDFDSYIESCKASQLDQVLDMLHENLEANFMSVITEDFAKTLKPN